jgi:hypothetical protein
MMLVLVWLGKIVCLEMVAERPLYERTDCYHGRGRQSQERILWQLLYWNSNGCHCLVETAASIAGLNLAKLDLAGARCKAQVGSAEISRGEEANKPTHEVDLQLDHAPPRFCHGSEYMDKR